MTTENKNAVNCPYCGKHQLDYDPLSNDYFCEDGESRECDDCGLYFTYSAVATKRFEPKDCKQFDPVTGQCKWELEDRDYDQQCDHPTGCCPTASDFVAWIDDYKIVVEKET